METENALMWQHICFVRKQLRFYNESAFLFGYGDSCMGKQLQVLCNMFSQSAEWKHSDKAVGPVHEIAVIVLNGFI